VFAGNGNEDEMFAIQSYLAEQYVNLVEEVRKAKPVKPSEVYAFIAGQNAAKNVSLHKPVQSRQNAKLS
jgi:hypothetical protein